MMKKFTEINRKNCKGIREAAKAALVDKMEEIGLRVSFGAGSFDHNQFTVKVFFILEDRDPQKDLFIQTAEQFGVKAEDHGRIITVNRIEYRLKGVNLKASRFPFVCERVSDGKVFRMEERAVQMAVVRSRENLLGQGGGE
jgi:hypothetical protein